MTTSARSSGKIYVLDPRPIVLLAALLAGVAAAAEENAFSRANQLLFLSDHMNGVATPAVLHYTFEKRGTVEETYNDTIDITLSETEGDGKRAVIRYFTGARNHYVPPIADVKGNPVVTLFLQRDVDEMEQRTAGSWRYFQKVIKLALEKEAKVNPVTFEYHGETVSGTEIRIKPYEDDPHRAQIEPYARKYYVFTFSEAVPGEVYQLRSVVPDASQPSSSSSGAGPLIEEILTFSGAEPLASTRRSAH